jgi:hypothetical protein
MTKTSPPLVDDGAVQDALAAVRTDGHHMAQLHADLLPQVAQLAALAKTFAENDARYISEVRRYRAAVAAAQPPPELPPPPAWHWNGTSWDLEHPPAPPPAQPLHDLPNGMSYFNGGGVVTERVTDDHGHHHQGDGGSLPGRLLQDLIDQALAAVGAQPAPAGRGLQQGWLEEVGSL